MEFDSNLVRSTVEPLVLKLVSERAMYGYEIIKVVNERTNGVFEWKEGTLYPCLHRLEGEGLIASEWRQEGTAKPRKYYAITRKGAKVLVGKTEEWRAFVQSVSALLFVSPKTAGI